MTLCNLAKSEEFQILIVTHGGMIPLVDIAKCTSDSYGYFAGMTLCNLVSNF